MGTCFPRGIIEPSCGPLGLGGKKKTMARVSDCCSVGCSSFPAIHLWRKVYITHRPALPTMFA